MPTLELEYRRQWQAENREKAMSYRRAYKERARARYQEYMAGLRCGCGYAADSLHHIDPSTKEFDPSRPMPESRQREEWAKCEPLCRSCHSKHHRKEG